MQIIALLHRAFGAIEKRCTLLKVAIPSLIFSALLNSAPAQTLSPLWSIAPGTAGYDLVITNDQTRGVAYNPVTDNFLYIRRTGSTTGIKIKRLNGSTGELLSDINTDSTVITGGSATLSGLAATEDGVIYACNISGSVSVTPVFKLYRWANESAAPVLVYSGSLDSSLARVGDAMAVRGTGTNTLIVVGSDQLTVAFLTTTNETGAVGSWTAKKITVTGGTANFYRTALAFGAGDSFYGKTSGNNLHRVNFNLAAGTATLALSYPVGTVPGTVAGLAFDPSQKLLLGVTRSSTTGVNHTNYLWDLTIPDSPRQLDAKAFPTANADGAAGTTGAALGGGKAFGSVQNNGLVAYQLAFVLSISAQPESQTVVQGGYTTLSVTADGIPPLSYQWFHNEAEIPGATTNFFILTNFSISDTGKYTVRITNSTESIVSSNAVLTLQPTVFSDVMTPLWRIAPGSSSHPFLLNDGGSRGIAYNPFTGNLLVVSRSASNAVHVLDAQTGAYLRSLKWDAGLITGGTLSVNMIGVSEDGAVYVGNLTQNGVTTPFRLYRWFDDSPDALPELAWQGDPGSGTPNRWGDTFSIRGNETFPQILLGSRTGIVASVISPSFGVNSMPLVIRTDADAGNFGLGIAFGADDSFWGKAPALPLRLIQYDGGAGTGNTIANFGNYQNMGPIGVDLANGLLAGISVETPDNLRLLDISSGTPVLLDTEFFPADNANQNGTGSIAFAPGRVYALDSNNGLIAMSLNCLPSSLQIQPSGANVVVSWTRSGYRLQGATELTDPPSNTLWSNISGPSPVTVPATGAAKFFRLICP